LTAQVIAFSQQGPFFIETRPDRTFTFTALPAGVYRLMATGAGEKNDLRSRWTEVRLDNADVADVELGLLTGEELTGVLEMPGDRAMAAITLLPEGNPGFGMQGVGETDKNGAFHIVNLFPDHYRVQVEPLTGNSYIKELKLDSSVMDGLLDLSSGVHGAKLKITVSPDGGELKGTVTSTPAKVFLVADPNQIRSENMVEATPEKTWSIHGIRPGKYRLFSTGDSFESLDALKPIAAKATEIEIKAGDRITKELTPDAK
jgi:hypothetical protein